MVHHQQCSYCLTDCHASRAHCTTFQSPDLTQTIALYIIGFVDDSMLGQANAFLLGTQPHGHGTFDWNDAQVCIFMDESIVELPKMHLSCVIDHAFTLHGAPYPMCGRQVGSDITMLQTGNSTSQQKIPFKSNIVPD
jgi:hypothetical protein